MALELQDPGYMSGIRARQQAKSRALSVQALTSQITGEDISQILNDDIMIYPSPLLGFY